MEKWKPIILSVQVLWIALGTLTSTGWVGSSGYHWSPERSTSLLCHGQERIDLMMLNLSLSPRLQQWIDFWNYIKTHRPEIKYVESEAHVSRSLVCISSTVYQICFSKTHTVNLQGSNCCLIWGSKEDLGLKFLQLVFKV
jgi:hypothetical protein